MIDAIETKSPTIQESSASCGSLSPETIQRIKNVALGALVAVVELPLSILTEYGIESLMKCFDLEITTDQELFRIWKFIDNIPSPMISVTLKVMLVGYAVFLGPVLEEIVFRGPVYSWVKSKVDNSYCNKILLVIGNGFIFGVCHLSFGQGLANVPIFFVTLLMGCILAALREYTGGITASVTTHILYNGTAMFLFLGGI